MSSILALKSDSQEASPSTVIRRDIQGVRAVAVAMVILGHVELLPGGFLGVDVFFVISGFVVTGMLVREWESTGQIRVGAFFKRRFARLVPALAAMVAITVSATALILSPLGPQQTAAKTGLGAVFHFANKVIADNTGDYFDAPASTNPLLHTWSLSVEAQFYAFFILLIVTLLHGSRGRLRVVSATCLAVSFGVVFTVLLYLAPHSSQGWTWLFGYYGPVPRFWEFAVGAVVYLVLRSPRWSARLSRFSLAPIGLATILASAVAVEGGAEHLMIWTAVPVLGCAMLILGGGRPAPRTVQMLSSGLVVAVGDRSYSIYLWHWPPIVLFSILFPTHQWVPFVAVLISVPLALLSFEFVEKRRFVFSRLSGDRFIAFGVTAVSMPAVVSLVVLGLARDVWTPRIESLVGEAQQLPAGYARGCHFGPETASDALTPCFWNSESPPGWTYLIGDSNAAHFTEGLVAATRGRSRLAVLTGSSCPSLDLNLIGPTNGYGVRCQEHSRRVLEWLQHQSPGTVYLASFDGYWLDPDYSIRTQDGAILSLSKDKIRSMSDALEVAIRTLRAAGHDVRIIQTIPSFEGELRWDPSTCTFWDSLKGCPQSMNLESALQRSSAVRNAINRVGGRSGAKVIDFATTICPAGTCRSHDGVRAVYRDSNHITVAMSEAVAGGFG